MRERLTQLIHAAHMAIADRDDNRDTYTAIADHLIDNGVIVPPVKVGQTVWFPSKYYEKAFPITIERMEIFEEETIMYSDGGTEWYEIDINNTIFLTREAAEAALKAREKQ